MDHSLKCKLNYAPAINTPQEEFIKRWQPVSNLHHIFNL